MKSPLQEQICCVRRLFVQVKFLVEHLHCVRRLIVQVKFLAEHLHCVRRLFVQVKFLPEHLHCVRRLFVQVKILPEHLHCVRRLFVQVKLLAEHICCARSNFVNRFAFTGTCLLRTYYTALLTHPLISTALHGAPSHPPRLIGCAHRKYLPSGTSDSLIPSRRTTSRASRI